MAKKKPTKRPAHRPSRYKTEYCDMATRAAMLGETNENMAVFFGVGISTFMRWMQRYKEFREAIKKGRATSDQEVALSLYKRACGFFHPETNQYFPPDTAAAFIWLKNRRPDLWRDKPVRSDDPGGDKPLSIKIVMEDAS